MTDRASHLTAPHKTRLPPLIVTVSDSQYKADRGSDTRLSPIDTGLCIKGKPGFHNCFFCEEIGMSGYTVKNVTKYSRLGGAISRFGFIS